MRRVSSRFLIGISLLLAIQLSGCYPEEDRAPRPQRPGIGEDGMPLPPTPEQVAAKIIADAQLDAPMPARGATLPPAVRQNILDLLRREHARLNGTEEGKRALAIVSRKIDERVRAYERAELWEHTITFIRAHTIFNANSGKFNHVLDKALLELRKPRVTVRGLPEFDGRTVAFLSIYLPETSETFFEKMGIGEEMHGIRLVSIFGVDRGVRLEYLETGERFVVYLPAAM